MELTAEMNFQHFLYLNTRVGKQASKVSKPTAQKGQPSEAYNSLQSPHHCRPRLPKSGLE